MLILIQRCFDVADSITEIGELFLRSKHKKSFSGNLYSALGFIAVSSKRKTFPPHDLLMLSNDETRFDVITTEKKAKPISPGETLLVLFASD